jgi:AcrR family transcriptional regulator
MARATADKVEETRKDLLRAAKQVLTEHGFAGLSTRRVADAAATQMSQIQYHFGSKHGLILALFEDMNRELLNRQAAMYGSDTLSLSDQWDLACDYLEEDIATGYVRVFHELIAAGWADQSIRHKMIAGLKGWQDVLRAVAARTIARYGPLGPFTAEEIAALVSSAFIGAEAQILLGIGEEAWPIRAALRKVGDLIRLLETQDTGGQHAR